MTRQPLASLALLVAGLCAFSTPARALEGTLKAIKDRKAIVVGYLKDAFPMSFESPSGPDGYSVELCSRVAAEAGKAVGIEKLDIKYVALTLDNRLDAVASGKVDIECGTTTMTLRRFEQVDFSLPVFVDGASVLTNAGAKTKELADLSGKLFMKPGD